MTTTPTPAPASARRVKPQLEILRWEEPPPTRRPPWFQPPRGSRYDHMAEQLRERRGQWAVVFEGEKEQGSGLAANIRGGHVACFTPTGNFEATGRVEGRHVTVYARYVGDTDAEAVQS